MDSVQKGLRSGQIDMDTFERLSCATCGVRLRTKNDPDAVGIVRFCPECGRSWRKL